MKKLIFAAFIIVLFFPLESGAQENTLKDARVGEWALYSTSNGKMQERHSVIARRREVVVIKIESIINGRTISSKIQNLQVDNPDFLEGASGQTTIKVGNTSYNCFAVGKGKRSFFYSNAVPVTGLVAVRKDGEKLKEIINFGN